MYRAIVAWMAGVAEPEGEADQGVPEDEEEDTEMHRRTLEFARNAGAMESMKVAQAEYGKARVKLTLAEREIVKLKREVNSLTETLHVHLARSGPFVPPYALEEEPLGGAGIPPRAARSCETCIASKTRCDQGRPCRLCRSRGVECVYTPPKKRGPKSKSMAAFESEFHD